MCLACAQVQFNGFMAETLTFARGGFTVTANNPRNLRNLEFRRGTLFNEDGSPIVGLGIEGTEGSDNLKILGDPPGGGGSGGSDTSDARSSSDAVIRRVDTSFGDGDDRLVIRGGTSVNSSIDMGEGDDFLVFGGDVRNLDIDLGAGADEVRFRGDVRRTRIDLGNDGDRDVIKLDADADIKGLRIRGADESDVLFIGSSEYQYEGGRTWRNIDDADDVFKA